MISMLKIKTQIFFGNGFEKKDYLGLLNVEIPQYLVHLKLIM